MREKGTLISIVAPMYNEADNVKDLIESITSVMKDYDAWEFIPVDDGSSDDTKAKLEEAAAADDRVRPILYSPNRGQGYAIRRGFKAARGDIVVTVDADMSYSPTDIPKLLGPLFDDELLDITSGSPFLPGAAMVGVPFFRALLSRCANWLLGIALPGHLKSVTGMFRGYRKDSLDLLLLESKGKEIHFEIISKALATGMQILEVPATLTGRKEGRSSIRVFDAIISHLLFSFFEKPAIFFEFIGSIMLFLGLASGLYIIWLWQHAELDPTRPLMILMVLLIILGAVVLSFGFIASQILGVRKEIYRVQKENLKIKRRLDKDRNT